MWNEIKLDFHRWGKLDLSPMGRISVIKMTVLPKMFFDSILPILIKDLSFKQGQEDISKFDFLSRWLLHGKGSPLY